MSKRLTAADRVGLVHPAVDVHTLGISSVEQMLAECGLEVRTADPRTCEAFGAPYRSENRTLIKAWIREKRISVLGFSYRLDPHEGAELFAGLVHELKRQRLLAVQGGPLKALYFAGLPEACEQVKRNVPETSGLFYGDESQAETLEKLGVRADLIPRQLGESVLYDEARMDFGREIVRRADYGGEKAPERGSYSGYGSSSDGIVRRLLNARQRGILPVVRAHSGPYLPDREAAVKLFLEWASRLAGTGYLDVLSIGTSQLSQSSFGKDWNGMADGGGVPINSPEEFSSVWQAARPMLVRCYAGTSQIPALARLFEHSINIAWHAFSLWWFSSLDGRGMNTPLENLRQHAETIKYAAATGKPFEPNVPHHFAFRGGDDVSYIVSAVIAARFAKKLGIRHLILQNMLNTPKQTWGIQDLAKSRAMLELVRGMEDPNFSVILQTRGGLDYFSHQPEKAKAQLAAVTALMDDIEPRNENSPQIMHVVSYSEGFRLADPEVIDESIRISRHALQQYRLLRRKGQVDDMSTHHEVRERQAELLREARTVLRAIENSVPDYLSPEGLDKVFAMGFLPVPYLSRCRDEYPAAVAQPTKIIRGSVKTVDQNGIPLSAAERLELLKLLKP